MIINCKSCQKKFVVPDQAITSLGRMVQCGSCGNKWKQFPLSLNKETSIQNNKKTNIRKISKKTQPLKTKNLKKKKKREINLYSREYLAKKHGINLDKSINENKINKNLNNEISFGFYGFVLVTLIFLIVTLKLIYFFQEDIVSRFPFLKLYLDILFENIKNIFQIWRDLVTSY